MVTMVETANARLYPRSIMFDRAITLTALKDKGNKLTQARASLDEKAPLGLVIKDRYEKIGHVFQAVETILNETQNPQADLQDVFKKALTPVAEAYGLEVVQGDPTKDATYKGRILKHSQAYKTTTIDQKDRGCKIKCVSWLSVEEFRRRNVEEETDDHSTRTTRRTTQRLPDPAGSLWGKRDYQAVHQRDD